MTEGQGHVGRWERRAGIANGITPGEGQTLATGKLDQRAQGQQHSQSEVGMFHQRRLIRL
ncbi:hypothetical protein [Spirosoma profusum]|uniref:hypothetical protein n=1 Tax=Spirosoma profusum TaxID=2771354 RepID=UPI001683FFD1|nr:hypothetical protein [Spirosoma profusum]